MDSDSRASSIDINYASQSKSITKIGAFGRCFLWTAAISALAALPILITETKWVVNNDPSDTSKFFQDGSMMLFVLGLLGGLWMDFVLDPKKDNLRISIRNRERDCRWLFYFFPIVGIVVAGLVLVAIASNPGHVVSGGISLEWGVISWTILTALILKLVMFVNR